MELTAAIMIIRRLWNYVVARHTNVDPAMFSIEFRTVFMTRSAIHTTPTIHMTFAMSSRMKITRSMPSASPSSRSYLPSVECRTQSSFSIVTQLLASACNT